MLPMLSLGRRRLYIFIVFLFEDSIIGFLHPYYYFHQFSKSKSVQQIPPLDWSLRDEIPRVALLKSINFERTRGNIKIDDFGLTPGGFDEVGVNGLGWNCPCLGSRYVPGLMHYYLLLLLKTVKRDMNGSLHNPE